MSDKKFKILIADKIPISPFRKLPPRMFEILYKPGMSNDDILKHHPYSNILVIRSVRKIGKIFLRNSNLKIIATVSKGTDHIDISEAAKLGIKIINCESGNVISAAEHTIGSMISAMRNFPLSAKKVKSNFSNTAFKRNELYKKTLGIFGYGKIGKLVYKYAKTFGMKIVVSEIDENVIARNTHVNFVLDEELLKSSDIITLHIPLNQNNKKFLNRKKMSLVKPGTVLINTSRGEVIEEKWLVEFLKIGHIGFAALDVFENEPRINPSLLKLDNVILTNHIAGKTEESNLRLVEEIVSKIKDCIGLYVR